MRLPDLGRVPEHVGRIPGFGGTGRRRRVSPAVSRLP